MIIFTLRFPTNEEYMQQWLANIWREGWIPAKSSVVRFNHFHESDIKRQGQRVTLQSGAVPKRFKSGSHHLNLDPNDPLTPILHDRPYLMKDSVHCNSEEGPKKIEDLERIATVSDNADEENSDKQVEFF